MTEVTEIAVSVQSHPYPVFIADQLLANAQVTQSAMARANAQVAQSAVAQATAELSQYCLGSQVLIVTNPTVASHYLPAVLARLQGKQVAVCSIEDGERFKSLASAERIFAELGALRASRDVTLIALGGGMIGDLTGFAAALWMRGVDFVQIPTTLLAMVDSSVGGKTAVNLATGKNLIGAFWHPKAVFADLATLDTLPARELSAGFAEVIKYGAINDPEFFAWLEQHADGLLARDAALLQRAIATSVANKASVVQRDPIEKGERMLLNFGHTFGHALELAGNYQELLHGEAVAIGMAAAALLSVQLGDELQRARLQHDAARLLNLLSKFALEPSHLIRHLSKQFSAQQLLEWMKLDKKALSGELRLILWHGIGQAYVSRAADPEIINVWQSIGFAASDSN